MFLVFRLIFFIFRLFLFLVELVMGWMVMPMMNKRSNFLSHEESERYLCKE